MKSQEETMTEDKVKTLFEKGVQLMLQEYS